MYRKWPNVGRLNLEKINTTNFLNTEAFLHINIDVNNTDHEKTETYTSRAGPETTLAAGRQIYTDKIRNQRWEEEKSTLARTNKPTLAGL